MTFRPSKVARVLAALALLGASAEAAAQAPIEYSTYEKQSIKAALEKVGGSIEPSPEGRVIERVEVVPLDVIEPRDPAPAFVNSLHATTRPSTIRALSLVEPGQRYRQFLVDDTCKLLRGEVQLSLVLCLPITGSTPDRVRVLLITKDVWSLRLNSNYTFADKKLEYLLLQPSELNLFGTHQIISGDFAYELDRFTFGAAYAPPVVPGSHINSHASIDMYFNRETGISEGTAGSFVYGSPLYSLATEWAWGANISWRKEVTRRYVGGQIGRYPDDLAALPADLPAGLGSIDWIYTTDVVAMSDFVTRSFGLGVKHDFTVGLGASRNVYRLPDGTVADPVLAASFVANEVPVTDTRIGPFFQYHSYDARFTSALNVETLGLQEIFALGHDFYLSVRPVSRAFFASRDFVGLRAAGAYTVPLRDGLVRAFVDAVAEVVPPSAVHENEQGQLPDANVTLGMRFVSPSTKIGRLNFDAQVVDRVNNYLNSKSTLGGDTRLRGYPSGAFIGNNLVVANLEFRSRPVEILTLQLGGVAFFDAGDAFDSFSETHPKGAVGIGLRGVFPQLDRTVTRLDWGIPTNPGYYLPGTFPGNIVLTFGQAFGFPGLSNGY